MSDKKENPKTGKTDKKKSPEVAVQDAEQTREEVKDVVTYSISRGKILFARKLKEELKQASSESPSKKICDLLDQLSEQNTPEDLAILSATKRFKEIEAVFNEIKRVGAAHTLTAMYIQFIEEEAKRGNEVPESLEDLEKRLQEAEKAMADAIKEAHPELFVDHLEFSTGLSPEAGHAFFGGVPNDKPADDVGERESDMPPPLPTGDEESEEEITEIDDSDFIKDEEPPEESAPSSNEELIQEIDGVLEEVNQEEQSSEGKDTNTTQIMPQPNVVVDDQKDAGLKSAPSFEEVQKANGAAADEQKPEEQPSEGDEGKVGELIQALDEARKSGVKTGIEKAVNELENATKDFDPEKDYNSDNAYFEEFLENGYVQAFMKIAQAYKALNQQKKYLKEKLALEEKMIENFKKAHKILSKTRGANIKDADHTFDFSSVCIHLGNMDVWRTDEDRAELYHNAASAVKKLDNNKKKFIIYNGIRKALTKKQESGKNLELAEMKALNMALREILNAAITGDIELDEKTKSAYEQQRVPLVKAIQEKRKAAKK